MTSGSQRVSIRAHKALIQEYGELQQKYRAQALQVQELGVALRHAEHEAASSVKGNPHIREWIDELVKTKYVWRLTIALRSLSNTPMGGQ